MIVGVPTEIKMQEHRVSVVPGAVRTLVGRGHRVLVQSGAGLGSGFDDAEYLTAGAQIAPDAAAVFDTAELIVKVKEPQPVELALLRSHHLLFTYLHLAPDPDQAAGLLSSGCAAIAYETVERGDGSLPLLAPMSQVAGRMAVQAGAHELERHRGGRGVLLAGIPGVRPGRVLILGGGNVGANAAQMATGLGADVVLMDIRPSVLEHLDALYRGRLKTVIASEHAVAEELAQADLVIGAVLVAGGRAPTLITRALLRTMLPGAVVADVSIDQGGCMETSRPTTHAAPTYVEEGVVHYCVANMPGAVARTSTLGLTNATLPYLLRLADQGLGALAEDAALAKGLNVFQGGVTHPAVAAALNLPHRPYSA